MVMNKRLRKLFVVLVVLCIIGIPVIGLLNNWWGNQDKFEEGMFWLTFSLIVNPVAIILIGGIVIAVLWGIYKMLLFLINRLEMGKAKNEQKQ